VKERKKVEYLYYFYPDNIEKLKPIKVYFIHYENEKIYDETLVQLTEKTKMKTLTAKIEHGKNHDEYLKQYKALQANLDHSCFWYLAGY